MMLSERIQALIHATEVGGGARLLGLRNLRHMLSVGSR